ncbi:hypothetical protein JXB41_07605 [Candidatus Woesearchaeota archaeon]|nr:hypothetical protein [Candidatus Woesearchaeota archaeon]
MKLFPGKKSSLNLSINAIVVLIIAITMLTLALGFIRSLFGQATSSLTDALSGIDESRKNTFLENCHEDICLEKTSITTQKNKREIVLLAINNRFDCTMPASISISGEEGGTKNPGDCQKMGGATDAYCSQISLTTFSPQDVQDKSKIIVPIEVNVKSSAKNTIYRYPVEVSGICKPEGGSDSSIDKKIYLDIDVTG